ncbi:hypothetical protein MNB_SUP05-SYMBIONT-5-914 [hydrothermal vent metagenome]|uniref:AAA+ ATPase domain-containing protein n=1 Tax=hydrothermal vent metagenome TaxID=652676 RepID=A0A1W1E1X2_9ZZZZ
MEFIDANFDTPKGGNMKEIELLRSKKQIILQGSPGTGKTYLAKQIVEEITLKNKNSVFTKEFIKDNLITGTFLKTDSGQKFKVLGVNFDKNEIYYNFKDNNSYKLKIGNKKVTNDLEIFNIIDVDNHYSPEYRKSIERYLNLKKYSTIIQFHPAYSYEDFVRGIVAETGEEGISYTVKNKVLAEMAENALETPDKDFVLIIDEINRANLSAVLGELIYALEYRGEAVESMYEYEGSRKIILPENLYIIGTMNTADRSVGYIDYAIRRRFAFVDVDTDKSVIPAGEATTLFEAVEKLFNKHLNKEEFELNDVMIGHSYFLQDDLELALAYEIKPILHEYRKDGVLVDREDKLKDKIEALKTED